MFLRRVLCLDLLRFLVNMLNSDITGLIAFQHPGNTFYSLQSLHQDVSDLSVVRYYSTLDAALALHDNKIDALYSNRETVKHLIQMLTPEIQELIQRQRLKFLRSGTRFSKYKKEGGKERGKYVFLKLSNNHKALFFGDWNEENSSPTSEQLNNKVSIADIKDFITGTACPHVRDSNRRNRDRNSEAWAFSFIKENGDSVDFIAANAKTFDYWYSIFNLLCNSSPLIFLKIPSWFFRCDGMNALLRRDMNSAKALEDLEMLLSMEVKIRLLDVEGIDIPDEPPPLPPLPNSLDFKELAF